MEDCIFCKIVKGEIPAEKVFENDSILAFYDNDPSAETHILIIPKKHIANFLEIKKEDSEILGQIARVAQQLIHEKKIENKYKLIINGGEHQFVPHLHLHILGGNLKKNA